MTTPGGEQDPQLARLLRETLNRENLDDGERAALEELMASPLPGDEAQGDGSPGESPLPGDVRRSRPDDYDDDE